MEERNGLGSIVTLVIDSAVDPPAAPLAPPLSLAFKSTFVPAQLLNMSPICKRTSKYKFYLLPCLLQKLLAIIHKLIHQLECIY